MLKRSLISLWISSVVFLLVACSQGNNSTATVTTNTSALASLTSSLTTAPATQVVVAVTTSPVITAVLTRATLTLTPTSQATTTNTPLPPTIAASATPVPFQATEETIGKANCCQEFNFASDGRLYYYDKPDGAVRAATYVYNIASKQRTLLTEQFGSFSADLSLLSISRRDTGTTVIQQLKDGATLATLQNKGETVVFSPNNRRLAYLLRLPTPEGASAPQRFELWVGDINGANLRVVWSLREGTNLAWFPDNRRLLLTARDTANQRFGLWVIDTEAIAAQSAKLIIESKGLLTANLSNNGNSITYAIVLQGDAKSGGWLTDANGTTPRKFNWQGSWAWSGSNADELIYVPNRASGEAANSLWSYSLSSGQSKRLTDPALLALQIAEDQWRLSPDGKNLIYRHASDYTLRWLRLRP